MGKLASLLIVTVALGGGGAAGLYGYRLNQSRVNALASADARGRDLAECRSNLAVEKTAKEQSQKVATDASTTLAASSTELEALRKQRAEADKRLAAFKEITEKFRKMIDSGKLSVIHRNGRMVVKLPAGVMFASGSADISNEGRAALADVATILKQFPDRRFMVAGHTDNVPLVTSPFKNNWELSTARAVTVTTQLITAGMKPDRLAVATANMNRCAPTTATPAGTRIGGSRSCCCRTSRSCRRWRSRRTRSAPGAGQLRAGQAPLRFRAPPARGGIRPRLRRRRGRAPDSCRALVRLGR